MWVSGGRASQARAEAEFSDPLQGISPDSPVLSSEFPNRVSVSLLGPLQQSATDWGGHTRGIFCHSTEGWKAKMKMLAELVYSEAAVFGV